MSAKPPPQQLRLPLPPALSPDPTPRQEQLLALLAQLLLAAARRRGSTPQEVDDER